MSDGTLFGDDEPATRPVGPSLYAVRRTLTAWIEAGHLAGDEHAAEVRVLEDAARAVDAARADLKTGAASAFSFARCNELLRLALDALGPAEGGGGGDAIDRLLAEFSSGPVRDTA
ncbi:hypothetical protein [uncultured Microbacterium sp.]|uniref:hypothetical protein n=1 Tax=uncultured Microbacterium sp. TaxID=191216 RepID=UPI0025D775F7|nr:hypothetical protein [uncultured Microbacterium sp.]